MDYREDSKRFWRGSIKSEDGGMLVWFASEDVNTTIRELKGGELCLHVDGTFAVVPELATQLFIVSADVGGLVSIFNLKQEQNSLL